MVPTAQFVAPSGKLTKRPPAAGPAALPRRQKQQQQQQRRKGGAQGNAGSETAAAVEEVEAGGARGRGGYLDAPSQAIADFRPRAESEKVPGRRSPPF
jgi:hypothetical protein